MITEIFKSISMLKKYQQEFEKKLEEQLRLNEVLIQKMEFLESLSELPEMEMVFEKVFPTRYMITFGKESGDREEHAMAFTRLENHVKEKIPILASDRVGVFADEQLLMPRDELISAVPMLMVSPDYAEQRYLKQIPEGKYVCMFYKNGILEKYDPSFEKLKSYIAEKEYPDNLSGGQQQRVALARSIVQQPKVLLLDEPLSAIDAKLRKSLQNSIREVHKKLGLTSIFVTHDQDEAMVMSDTIHLFHAGKIEQSSSPIEMYTSPVSKFAATFIGNYNVLSEEQFETMTGQKTEAPEGIAIRPETLQIISGNEPEADYTFEGTIMDNTPKGNVLQYHVETKGIKLKIDVLFRSKSLFQNGTKVRITVADHNCIRL